MALLFYSGKDGHFFVDDEFDVDVGQTWEKEDGTWAVDMPDGPALQAPSLEEAKRLFVRLYDPSKVALAPWSGPAFTSAYTYCEEQDDGTWLVETDEEDIVVATEVEAVNLVKKSYPHDEFAFEGLEGEEGEDHYAGFEIEVLAEDRR